MIQMRYSGGASNDTPALSVGGAVSSVAVAQQSVAMLTPIAGITLASAAGCRADSGLSALSASLTVQKLASGVAVWFSAYGYAPGALSAAAGNYKFVTAAADISLYCGDAYLQLSVDPTLVVGDSASNLSVENVPNALFPDVLVHPAPIVDRCVFLANMSAAEATVVLRTTRQSAAASVSLAKANAAGSPTGTDVSALTFGASVSVTIPGNEVHAIWLRLSPEYVEVPTDVADGILLEAEVT